MALITGSKYGLMVYNGVADESPAPSLNQSFTISKTVGGFPLVITMDPPRCLCPISMTWNGITFATTLGDHGTGICAADNLLADPTDASSWNAYSPTGPGCQSDGTNLRKGTSVSLARYLDADGAGFRHIQNPAYWLNPGEVLSPGHPARNAAIVSRMKRDIYMRIGSWSGATWATDQIISWVAILTVPTDAQMQREKSLKMCPLTLYSSDSVFNQQEYVDASTGTASAYPGYPANSATQCVMTSHSDGTKAVAAYVPRSELLTRGFYQGYNATGVYDTFVLCWEDYPSGVPAGTYTQHGYIAWGTRAQTIAALQTIYTNVG